MRSLLEHISEHVRIGYIDGIETEMPPMSERFGAEFDEVVNTAVLRVEGLPDAEFADRLLALAKGFQNVIQESAPQLTEGEVTILRQHFITTVAARCNMLGDDMGMPVGMRGLQSAA